MEPTTTILAHGPNWTLRRDGSGPAVLEVRDMAYECQTRDAALDGPHTIVAVCVLDDLVALIMDNHKDATP